MSMSEIDNLLQEDRRFPPSAALQKSANISDPGVYERAARDPEAFWSEFARELEWIRPWDTVLQWKAPNARWFDGGKINASANCLDRHVRTARRNKAAIIWEGEPGDRRTLTYWDLYRQVSQFANVLKSLGVKRGDRVALYLPLVPELAIAMLACARIGAIHSVVFGGFSAESLRDRINDSQCVALITADGGYRRGNIVPLKRTADEALLETPSIKNVVVVRRLRGGEDTTSMTQGRDQWYHDLMQKAPIACEPEAMDAEDMEDVRELLRYPHGMILVVGPASSGRTTTLSSMVSALKSGRTNITTIEDPIEYLIPGINQTRVNEKAKLTFASSLRAILRQDPDVVLVGELRDQETAKMVTHAAQTGRLLVSSLHTDNAPSAVTRLIDMAIEPYVIASALIGVVAQRLVRRLCLTCRRQYTPEAEMLRALSISDDAGQVAFYKAVGCDECNHTGYQGRIALCEVMRVNDRMRRLIAQRAGEDLIREAAVESGMISLGEDGLGKVKAGITTPEELLRVVTEVREMRGLCPACSCAVAIDFHVCPGCGHRLGLGCPKCSRALQPGWNFCPYCSSSAVSKKKKKSKEHKPAEAPPSNVAEFKNQNR